MVSPSDYINEDDGISVDWLRLGRDIIGGVILAFLSGIIATIVAIREVIEDALEGAQTWMVSVIDTIESIILLAISKSVTTASVDLSILSVVAAIVSVLAAYYVFAWGVSQVNG